MGSAFIVRRGGKEPEPLIIETGLIVEFFGTVEEIPFGWALCDGSVVSGQPTPDLRNRFIVGAGDEYNVEETGGFTDTVVVAHSHSLTVETGGSHSHSFRKSQNFISGTFGNNKAQASSSISSKGISSTLSGAHSHSISIDNTGNSNTNANLPPYYSLLYIIKLEAN